MKTAAQIRAHVATVSGGKLSSALTVRPQNQPERVPCGIAIVDEQLHGGLPIGALTEFVGKDCSGRTSMALAYTAAGTLTGKVCAWIDASDALEPESVAANGVDLERLLWVRCGDVRQQPAESLSAASTIVSAAWDERTFPSRHTGGGSPHPRSEGRDMPEAIASMLQAHGGLYDKQLRREKRSIGTPGMPNRPLSQRSGQREEQVNSDRLPPRRGDNLTILPRCSEPLPRRIPAQHAGKRMSANPSTSFTRWNIGNPWQALDQALRATDLLLQSGGFSIIVLDMGNIPAEIAWRIPLATWFRFRAACERTRASVILLTQQPCARSSAELVVRLEPGNVEARNNVMIGMRYQVATERSRFKENIVSIRKPPQPERSNKWNSPAAWAQVR